MLLERGNSSGNTDFFSYRYLATEGFLPGYNFPRLPLYAFIPSGGYQGGNAAYLQRARFLAIAEFGPRSLIYHEGRAYRVNKARLPSNLPEGQLATERLFVCDNCGSAHKQETERCMACGDSIAGVQPILNVLRIDNVETEPAETSGRPASIPQKSPISRRRTARGCYPTPCTCRCAGALAHFARQDALELSLGPTSSCRCSWRCACRRSGSSSPMTSA